MNSNYSNFYTSLLFKIADNLSYTNSTANDRQMSTKIKGQNQTYESFKWLAQGLGKLVTELERILFYLMIFRANDFLLDPFTAYVHHV